MHSTTAWLRGRKRGVTAATAVVAAIVGLLVLNTPESRAAAVTWHPNSFSSISVGYSTTCAVADSAAYCWGDNTGGQLGGGSASSTPTTTPQLVSTGALSGATVTKVATAGNYACAVLGTGKLACWGTSSGLGLGTSPVYTPTIVGGALAGHTVTDVTLSKEGTTCAVADGVAYCWGYNILGQVGDGSTTTRAAPVAVRATSAPLQGKTVTKIVMGFWNTCALTSDGSMTCWGYNSQRQYGPSGNDSAVPVQIIASGVKDVAMASGETCYVTTPGVLRCIGSDVSGNLSTYTAKPFADSLAGQAASTVSSGGNSSGGTFCGVTSPSSTLYCFGDNPGSFGNGNQTRSATTLPADYSSSALSGETVASVSVGYQSTCVVLASAKMACTGVNSSGQLGTGTTTPTSTYKYVVIIPPVVAPSVPLNAAVALGADKLSAKVTWSPPASDGNATAPLTYTVRSNKPGGTFTSTGTFTTGSQSVTTNSLDATITGLPKGTSYYFTVEATNSSGSGSYAVTDAVKTLTTAPTQPRGTRATKTGPEDARVSWSAPLDDGGDAVKYVVTPTPGDVQPGTTTGTSYDFTHLKRNTSYSFTVRAVNTVGDSPLATAAGGVLTDPGAPDRPSAPVVEAAGPGTLAVTFAAVSGNGSEPVAYLVTLTDTSNPRRPDVAKSAAPGQVLFSNLAAGDEYVATVLASNAYGTSEASPRSAAAQPSGDVSGVTPAQAQPDSATGGSTVVVDGSLSLSLIDSDQSFTLEGLTGASASGPDSTISYDVTTNNLTGYTVSVTPDQESLVPSNSGNGDRVPFSAVSVSGGGGYLNLSTSTPAMIYSKSSRSDTAAGDVRTARFQVAVPFVNADTYTGTVTFTAAAQ